MSDNSQFGPLAGLIGVWKGDQGTDIAPEPDGPDTNPYFETITFTAVGDVENAQSQILWAIQYHEVVQRKSNGEVFHDQSGYWMWEPATGTVMHAFVIPRGVSVLAGGAYAGETDDAGRVLLDVAAHIDDPDWSILQSGFMRDNARTTEFRMKLTIGPDTLSYKETTLVDIYGRPAFVHTDENTLTRA